MVENENDRVHQASKDVCHQVFGGSNHVKFTEECMMHTKKHVLCHKKMFTNGLNKPKLKRQSMLWKHTDSPVMKRFQTQQFIKKVILTVFCNIKGPITID